MPARCRGLAAALVILAGSVAAQIPAGTYTIDPGLPAGGSNFQTWAAASTALSGGVIGPGHTVFIVASTTFAEAVTFQPIPGTSAAATITFIAQGAPAIINAAGFQDGLTLVNTQNYLIFENIEIRGWSRYGLYLFGTSSLRSSFCTFRRIVADGPATSSSTISALRNFYAWDCDFEDCRFLGGGYTMRSEQIVRNNFRRCEFDGKGVATNVLAPFNNNDADNRWENCFMHDGGASSVCVNIDLSSYGNMFWHNTIITSSSATAVMLGSLTGWSRTNSFRNNVVINWGAGVCMTYGANATTGILECNDLDYNVYYAPNGNIITKQGGVGFGTGSLASWQAYFGAATGIVVAGGGNDWDINSIEGDPGLVSSMAPYDIHLGPASVCRDGGTTLYIAGAWITYPAGSFVADDIDLDPRPLALVDIGSDEISCPSPQYETNGPAAGLDIDGLQGTACVAAVSTKTTGTPGYLNFTSANIGQGWDLGVAVAPIFPLSSGALVSASGQIVNLDLTAPTLLFLNGGGFPSFTVPYPGNFGFGFATPPGPLTVSAQFIILHPAHPDGISLSQAVQLDVP